jgi:hypothetical protein
VKRWTPEQRALVFPNSRGRIGKYSTFLEHVWTPLLAKAGLRYRKAHSMRHTFATWALEGSEAKGIPPAPILAVRDWMGHASVQETEGVSAPQPRQPRPCGGSPGRLREQLSASRRRTHNGRRVVMAPRPSLSLWAVGPAHATPRNYTQQVSSCAA